MIDAQIVFFRVGTQAQADARADLAQVEEVARTIAPLRDGYKVIVAKRSARTRVTGSSTGTGPWWGSLFIDDPVGEQSSGLRM